jgi:hypothetical protein
MSDRIEMLIIAYMRQAAVDPADAECYSGAAEIPWGTLCIQPGISLRSQFYFVRSHGLRARCG